MTQSLKAKLVAVLLAFLALGLFAADAVYQPQRMVEIAPPLPPPATRSAEFATPRECGADGGVSSSCTYQ